ncbi:MAG TPA: methionyl-tRNA formyltransferase [Dehalococcoidia bacterium]|jgi:methionyl-tRNA formyltransferase|nr:methionyl-tRNA formyltransferase [Dehalococcoidia bacterium]
MSVVFIGTPAFAVPSLRALVRAGHEVAAVITQPDRPAGRRRTLTPPPVKVAALELGLPVLQPASLRNSDTLTELHALFAEVFVVAAYGQILRQVVLDIPPRGVVNVHPSLLPRWRGASPIPAAILAGDDITGVTIMLMDAGMDSGPILTQVDASIDDTDSAGSLAARLSELGAELLVETLNRWLAGEIEPQAQDASRATTCPLIRKVDGAIDWGLTAKDIWRGVRAYNPWPGAFTTLDGELVHIWQAWPLDATADVVPGAVFGLDEGKSDLPAEIRDQGAFAVQTGDGILAPLEVQRAGRRALSAAEFLRGMPELVGRRFVSP